MASHFCFCLSCRCVWVGVWENENFSKKPRFIQILNMNSVNLDPSWNRFATVSKELLFVFGQHVLLLLLQTFPLVSLTYSDRLLRLLLAYPK